MHSSRIAAFCAACATLCALAAAAPCMAQSGDPGSVPQTDPSAGQSGAAAPQAGSSLLNPNTSVIGWFQAEAGDRVQHAGTKAFELREAELGFQAAVDPYSRADFFISVNPEEGIDLEEGYLTLLTLPAGISAKLGKFRSNFGKFNRTHPPETPFAARPISAERFLGEEGLSGMGASASWIVPNPLGIYADLDAEVTASPDSAVSPAFGSARGRDLLYVTRASGFVDLSEQTNLNFGVSYANGSQGFVVDDSTARTYTPRAQLYGADLTFRWRNPRRAIYRSLLVQAEVMERSAERLFVPSIVSRGAFAYADYQFARRWHAGARYDWSEDPTLAGVHATGGLAFLTFTPSEFALMSLQMSRAYQNNGWDETRYFFKTTFNIGPHGAHPF